MLHDVIVVAVILLGVLALGGIGALLSIISDAWSH